MEFKVYQKELELQSRGWIPTFHDVSREVIEVVKESGVKNGTVCIASHHTTCSVMIQECSHDIDSFDLEYLQHDLLDIMRKMIPDFAEEHQYRHPGPIHAQFGRYVNEPGDYTSMNTDGHLRSVFFGRSETMTIKDGVLDGGEFAHIYCRDSFKLMCGFSYMGTNNCPHYLNGECDGYVDAEPQLPELILDEDSNIKSGCSFELLLKSHNIDIKDIEVGIMRLVTYDEITNAAKKHFSA